VSTRNSPGLNVSEEEKKKDEKEEPKVPKIKIGYLGTDDGYWNNIKVRFEASFPPSKYKFEFIQFKEETEQEIQAIVPKVVSKGFSILYVDYTRSPEVCIAFVKILKRQQFLEFMVVVGLLDYREDFNFVQRAMMSGADFNHIKSGEIHDVVFCPGNLAFPEDVTLPSFATGKLSYTTEVHELFRLNYMTEETIRFETNMDFPNDQSFIFNLNIDEKLIPFPKMTILGRDGSNLFYNFEHGYEAVIDFIKQDDCGTEWQAHLDEMEAKRERIKKLNEQLEKEEENGKAIELDIENDDDDGLPKKLTEEEQLAEIEAKNKEKARRKERFAAMSDRLEKARKELQTYVRGEAMTGGLGKIVKVLSIDKKGAVFKQVEKLFHEYPFSFRWQALIPEPKELLESMRPQIITYQMEHLPEKEEERKKINLELFNHKDHLTKIIGDVLDIKGYQPFIVVFNAKKISAQSFIDSTGYSQILTQTTGYDLKVVLNLVDVLTKKLTKKDEDYWKGLLAAENKRAREEAEKAGKMSTKPIKMSAIKKEKVFFRKGDSKSWGTIQREICLKVATESEIYFTSEKKFEEGAVLRFDDPLSFWITVVPMVQKQVEKYKGQGLYRGLIHGMGQVEKQKMRRFVNTLFFKELELKKKKEREEFERIQKKAEELKAAEAAKAAAPAKGEGGDKAEAFKAEEASAPAPAAASAENDKESAPEASSGSDDDKKSA
jgi:hypothetical protein